MIELTHIKETNWEGKKISLLGAGKSGIAAAKLARYVGAAPFVSEKNDSPDLIEKISEFTYEIGEHSASVLDADLVVISPGISDQIPIVKDCRKENIPIVSEIEFASLFTDSPILALTGSNGKTTTVNLLHEMCVSDGRNSLLGGNVGIPFSENVLWELTSNLTTPPVHVLELSSFQLEHISSFSPMIAGILNITEDHMDRYTDINAYAREKLKIGLNIKDQGRLIYNADDPILVNSLKDSPRSQVFSVEKKVSCHFKLNASKVYSGEDDNPDILFKLNETILKGRHNLQNILAAATMAHAFGVSREAIRSTITNFTPIPHRLEWVGNLNRVDYFDDSKATNIAAARAAIESFDENLILILGGQDKGTTDFSQLFSSMENRVKAIVTYGQAGNEILNQLIANFDTTHFNNFNDAMNKASELSKPGDTVLLSPACASYDQFTNYEERGNAFKEQFSNLELAS